jgi:hypothetical protein
MTEINEKMKLDYLAKKNEHERDKYIEFDEGPHIYTVHGELGYTSVTTWNHHHFPEFDSNKIIDNMMGGKKWNDKEKNAKYWNQTTDKPMTKDEIKSMWDKNRDEAAAAGTAMHYDIECFYNNVLPNNTSTEYKYFENFWKDFQEEHPYLVPYRTEWMVYYEELKLSGSIDMIYEDTRDPTGNTLIIYDWKRCKEISHENNFSKAKTAVISHLPDTNFWHYSLQLNTYKKILEDKYGKKVTKLALVVLHPDNRNYEVHEVPILEKELNDLFEYRRNEVNKPIKQ